MSATVDGATLRRFIERYAALIEQRKDELTELDAAIGDADHGTNMQRGMQAARERLPAEGTPEAVLKAVATALISKVGGASGPLYGTAFLRAGAAVAGKATLEPSDVEGLFRAALEGVIARGHAELGDKTMVDAFSPAVDALGASLASGGSLETALAQAHEAAARGSDETIPIVARKGRASYLGERARGHRDPGSLSTTLLFEAAAEALGRQEGARDG
ncbi:MAG: dihydroxyacetone kinase subunit DhaL [Vulcanimicrobiaceae bacterium]|jgi:dihydroxyacetone kinase-like protein